MKRGLSLILALMLTLTLVPMAAAEEGRNFYDYHDYSQFPLGDGSESAANTISVAVRADPTYSSPAWDTWFWPWMKQASGLNFEIEQVLSTAINDKKNLMFVADDLPDVMIGFTFTTSQLVKYGQVEGQLLALNDYITPEIMPYLYQWFQDYPEYAALCTAPDGNIYSFPCFIAYAAGSSERFFWNTTWLEEVDKEIPNTLDEFLDVLYAMKAARPDSYPLGGGANGDDPRSYILNALGFLTPYNSDRGYNIALRNGEMVIPGGDETYREFLRIMHQLYEDEIINPSFFSMEKTAIDAMIAENKNGAIPIYPYLATPEVEKFQQWTSGYPLTSQWNDTKQWLKAAGMKIGGCVVSASCANPELVCRWIDFFFGDLGHLYQWNGPAANNDDCMGLTKGYVINPETGASTYVDVTDGTYESNLVRNYAQMMGFFDVFGARGHALGHPEITELNIMQKFYGAELTESTYDLTNGDQHYRHSMLEAMTPYETGDFPYIIYFDDETNNILSDLSSVINPYIETETAKFITGVRDLSEFDSYLEELEALDFSTYLGYYQEAYAAYLAAK